MTDIADVVISMTISNQLIKDGIVYAMNLRNSSLPETVQDKNPDGSPKVDEEGKPVMVANPELITDPSTYVTWVGTNACKSYARQKIENDFQEGRINKVERDALVANPAIA